MRPIVALAERQQRMPEAGRIRLGMQIPTRSGNKMRPTSITEFRFTSPHEFLIHAIAKLWGGEPRPWPGSQRGRQFEVVTTTSTIPILIPRGAFDVSYELWVAGGLQRRCDGVTVGVPTKTPDGWEPAEQPCMCAAENKLQCKPTSRLTVVLPDLPFFGVWRMDTKGWNALAELPNMIDIIDQLSSGGRLVRAELSIQQRSEVRFGETQNFVVPVIVLPYTPQQILQGAAEVRALASAPPPEMAALPAAPDNDCPHCHGEGFANDAWLEANEPISDGWQGHHPKCPVCAGAPADDTITDALEVEDDTELDKRNERMFEICQQQRLDHNRVWPAVKTYVGVTTTATPEQLARIDACVAKMESGALVVAGFNQSDGSIIWKVN